MLGVAEKLPFGDETFDFVVCSDVLHLTKKQEAIAEMRRVLKPGGHMLITMFCNTFTKDKAMAELEGLVGGWNMLDKRVVGNPNAELSAAILCGK